MPAVLRWGQSAYETDADLARERAAAERLGLAWSAVPESADPPLDGVDALVVTSRVRVDAPLLSRFRGSLVLTTTSGWEHIDVEAATERGVTVARCPLARRDAVAEAAIGGMVLGLRRQATLQRAAERGEWARSALPGLDPLALADATVLVVGLGVIGARVAELLRPFGATVLGVDPAVDRARMPAGVRPVALDDGLAAADVVTLHCAANPTTVGLFTAERIARCRPGAVLVNTARGTLVDVDAAVCAVAEGRLRGLVLDVFPEEPWPGLAGAAAIDGVWLTPHAVGYTRGLGARVAGEVEGALAAWVAGLPVPHEVHGHG
jgi:D-3-phosphoglycerate dehydrogenase / 2-oxoglutarate reductase